MNRTWLSTWIRLGTLMSIAGVSFYLRSIEQDPLNAQLFKVMGVAASGIFGWIVGTIIQERLNLKNPHTIRMSTPLHISNADQMGVDPENVFKKETFQKQPKAAEHLLEQ